MYRRFSSLACTAFIFAGCAQAGRVGELGDSGMPGSGDAGEPLETTIQRCRNIAFGLGGVCITYEQYPVFAMRCSAVNARVLHEFNACASAGGCPDDACLSLLVPQVEPEPEPPEHLERCQSGCEILLSFSCIDGVENTECFSLCETKSPATAEAFIECASFLCHRTGCMDGLRSGG